MKSIREQRQVITPFIASGDRTAIYKASIFDGFEICGDDYATGFLVCGIKKNEKRIFLSYENNRVDAEATLGKLMECISRSENFYFPIIKD